MFVLFLCFVLVYFEDIGFSVILRVMSQLSDQKPHLALGTETKAATGATLLNFNSLYNFFCDVVLAL